MQYTFSVRNQGINATNINTTIQSALSFPVKDMLTPVDLLGVYQISTSLMNSTAPSLFIPLVVRVVTDQGAQVDHVIYLTVDPPRVILSSSPSYLTGSALRLNQTLIPFTLTNVGTQTATNV